MDLSEYISKAKQEQWEILWTKGVFIKQILLEDSTYLLYALNDFYVEMEFFPNSRNSKSLFAFTYGNYLDRYLLGNSDEGTKFIPGHGPLSTKKEVQKYRDLLAGMLTIVEELTNEEMSINDIIAQVKVRMDYNHYSGNDFIMQVHRSVQNKPKE